MYDWLMKTCTQCKEAKPPEAFSKAKHTRDGRDPRCKDCRAKQNRTSYAANREKYKATRGAWYERNKEKHLARQKQRREETPEKFTEQVARRRSRQRNQTVGRVDYKRILERDGLWCYLCETEVARSDVAFDHVMPIARGGPHSENNIRVTHHDCNRRKAAKIMPEHMTPELLAIPVLLPDRRVKTHCPKGHPYEGDNLVINARGHKICRTCRNDRAREAGRKKKGYYERDRAPQTHCPNGHEWTEENTYRTPAGGRYCRECNREASRRRWDRLRG